MNQINLLLENQDVQAVDGVTFDRLNPVTGDVATRAAAAKIADVDPRRRCRGCGFSGLVGNRPEPAPHDPAEGSRRAGEQGAAIHRTDGRGNGRDRRLGRFQCPSRRRHAARSGIDDDADFRRGDPLRQTRLHRDGDPPARRRRAEHRALECAGHPRRPRGGSAAGLRQYRRPQGVGNLPRHPPADRGMSARGGAAAGRPQRHHQCAGRCAGADRGADFTSRGPAHQLHWIDARRAHHRADRREISQAGPARARRQGAAARARRCRPRCCGRRRGVRRLHEPGPDLHVDRADRGRPENRRRFCRQTRHQGGNAGGRRSAPGQYAARLADRHRRRRAGFRA